MALDLADSPKGQAWTSVRALPVAPGNHLFERRLPSMGTNPAQPAPNGGHSSASAAAFGAAAAAAGKTVGAGQAAGKGVAASFASWWQSLAANAGPMTGELKKAAKGLHTKAQGLKLAMPVDVKVDFLRPTAEAVRDSLQSVWVQLPPPVQQAAPYVGVAVGSGLIVFAVQQHRLKAQRNKTNEVTLELQSLLKERTTLLQQIRDLHSKPRTDMELRLSAAVAEATNAAAAAAEAAAHAAVACVIRRPPPAAPAS